MAQHHWFVHQSCCTVFWVAMEVMGRSCHLRNICYRSRPVKAGILNQATYPWRLTEEIFHEIQIFTGYCCYAKRRFEQ